MADFTTGFARGLTEAIRSFSEERRQRRRRQEEIAEKIASIPSEFEATAKAASALPEDIRKLLFPSAFPRPTPTESIINLLEGSIPPVSTTRTGVTGTLGPGGEIQPLPSGVNVEAAGVPEEFRVLGEIPRTREEVESLRRQRTGRILQELTRLLSGVQSEEETTINPNEPVPPEIPEGTIIQDDATGETFVARGGSWRKVGR